ncbi:unnamed protein product, partial [Larinioides sclopetarius]
MERNSQMSSRRESAIPATFRGNVPSQKGETLTGNANESSTQLAGESAGSSSASAGPSFPETTAELVCWESHDINIGGGNQKKIEWQPGCRNLPLSLESQDQNSNFDPSGGSSL